MMERLPSLILFLAMIFGAVLLLIYLIINEIIIYRLQKKLEEEMKDYIFIRRVGK